jgi:hypothetical protein
MGGKGARKAREQQETYWRSEACLEKLENSLVNWSCLLRWAGLQPVPLDGAEWKEEMQQVRQFYLTLLQRGNQATFHNSWAKACCMFNTVMAALIRAQSPLLKDVVLVAAVSLGISRKDETSAASCCYKDLVRVAALAEDQLRRPHQTRTCKELMNAEFDVFVALNWNIPQTDTYTCISAMLLRADILTQGRSKAGLEVAWQTAVQKCVRAELVGEALGYGTAYTIVRDAVEEVFGAPSLKRLFPEIAPPPQGWL